MAPGFLDPGLLNRRAILEMNEPAADAFGGAAEMWVEVAELSVRLEPIGISVEERFGQRVGVATHRVTLRFREGVARGMAFRIGSRRLLVRSVHDSDETKRFLICRCEEEA